MNIEARTVKQAREIAAQFGKAAAPSPRFEGSNMIGQRVIVRADKAGAVYGTLESLNGSTAIVSNARQMWSWTAKEGGTLIDCAAHGVKGGKFSAFADSVTVIDVCAIISVRESAAHSLDDASWS